MQRSDTEHKFTYEGLGISLICDLVDDQSWLNDPLRMFLKN